MLRDSHTYAFVDDHGYHWIMTERIQGGKSPNLGIDRPTTLFLVWLFIGLSITSLAILDGVNEGFTDATAFLFGGLVILWFVFREWVSRAGGEFMTRNDDTVFLAITLFALLVVVWSLAATFVV